jgi:hypothetical protein
MPPVILLLLDMATGAWPRECLGKVCSRDFLGSRGTLIE